MSLCQLSHRGALPIVLELGAVYPHASWAPMAPRDDSLDRIREVHHRVKNDLQLVSSMLTLQARQSLDAHVSQELEDAAHRIRAVASLHERLQQTGAERTDAAEYLADLCSRLEASSGCGALGVSIFFAGDSLELGGDKAMSLGLILNELVTNALKHAHRERPGHIDVRLYALSDTVLLTVADQGPGLAENALDQGAGIGLTFVRATARKLGGELTARNRASGAEIGVRFPRSKAPPQVGF